MDVFVIERLLKEKKFNLPYIMLKHMEAACESKKNLPYGLLFTKIFRYFGVALSSRERDTLTKCEQFDTAVLTRMGYRRTSRNTWVPKVRVVMRMRMLMRMWLRMRMSLRVRRLDAEAMEFDVDADLADDPPIIPSPTRVPDPTSSFDTRFTAFEERMTAMHEAQKKFIQGECYFYARGAEAVLCRDEDFYGPLSSSMIFIAYALHFICILYFSFLCISFL
ncbi:hypothetical protein CJ030_MR7G011820 [Morella rubra]|uniref:Uncharacterized protein n=1 Tax=Morella rubra TaxID=262757 RepID=A0A6A1V392_9ROSI|nr:hypothetical protein CJ030_MR7G011820 [Morella rubra]